MDKKIFEKIEKYRDKLLDFSRRNNLINFKNTKSSTLEIIAPDIDKVFEKISLSGSYYYVFDDFNLDDEEEISKTKKIEKLEKNNDLIINFDSEKNEIIEIIDSPTDQPKLPIELNNKNLPVKEIPNIFELKNEKEKMLLLYKNEISKSQILLFNYLNNSSATIKILNKLRLNSKTIMQEKGVNSLFIAFGFLKWFDNSNSSLFFKSPIILVPISITKKDCKFIISNFDEPVINQNLYFLFKNKFGVTFPQYNGQSLSEYLDEFEKKLNTLKDCEIYKEAKISLFNYNKISMYQDLKNNIEFFAANRNICKLFEERDSNSFSNDDLKEINDRKNTFIDQHNILEADFSQAQAIEMAKTGKSFVIQGPPGTGKSQTITNIIGELLFSGKKILFLSEKQAALEVIFNNLKKTKLQNLCLELHSFKTNKKDFIENIYETITTNEKEIVKNNKNDLEELLGRINNYEEKLHSLCSPTNKTLYQLMSLANHFNDLTNIKNDEFCDLVSLINLKVSDIEIDNITQLFKKYEDYEKLTKYNINNFPLYYLNFTDYSNSLIRHDFINLFKNYEQKIQEISNSFKENKSDRIDYLDNNLEKFVNQYLKISKVNFKTLNNLISVIDEIEKFQKKISELENQLDCNYHSDIYKENIQEIFDNYTSYSWFSRIFSLKFKNINNKISFYREKKKKNYLENVNDLKIILQIKKIKEKINNIIFLSDLKNDFKLNNISEDFKTDMLNLNRCVLEVPEAMDFYYDYLEIQTKCFKYFDVDIKLTFSEKLNFVKKIIDVFQNENIIRFMEYKDVLNEISKIGLKKFIEKLIEYKISTSKFIEYYKAIYYKFWAEHFLSETKLFKYNKNLHNDDINKFITCDKKQIEINRNLLINKSFFDDTDDSNEGFKQIIFREHKKKSNKKAIREILELTGNFIKKIKPVFLMSPLSVSNFLPIDFNFDVVIFDEASQIFPEEALGAICRSKQLIVVGDSKQMPPTNFFLLNDEDDEENEEFENYESIFDLCSIVFPIKTLLIHYRSRSEDLINFSNKNFYNGNLLAFPSVCNKKKDFGVEFIYVSNGYLGSNTTNIYEAKKIINLIFEHFKKNPERSLGVITLNIKQRDLIIDLLEKERVKNKSFEKFFDENIKESFFVKNLENVQGDERDTIFLSICYAKDSYGRLYHRFGPINGVGGERRLNVAITRAKFNMKVISSIHGRDIDLSRISNLGPKLLHDYLEYAEFGVDKSVVISNDKKFDSFFEEDVYNFLVKNGFNVDTQVGCSGYRIDLALKKPNSSDYVLAIECDGATYHSQKSARDRDYLRQAILERMQWKFYRIWSVDWFQNNQVEKEDLIKACKDALIKN